MRRLTLDCLPLVYHVDHYNTKSTDCQDHTESFILRYPNATLKLIKKWINAKLELLFNYYNITTMQTYTGMDGHTCLEN